MTVQSLEHRGVQVIHDRVYRTVDGRKCKQNVIHGYEGTGESMIYSVRRDVALVPM